jgi:hypothetical protein
MLWMMFGVFCKNWTIAEKLEAGIAAQSRGTSNYGQTRIGENEVVANGFLWTGYRAIKKNGRSGKS